LIGHKLGIRFGNNDIQIENLAAFMPLFPIVGRSNYAQSTIHFLSYIKSNVDLKILLDHVCSVHLTSPGNFFAFDEALETFGVKYIKQNIGRVLGNQDLKSRISSVQYEQERIDLLLSEYVGNTPFIYNDCNMKSRKEAMWKLVDELQIAFVQSNSSDLFKGTTQNNEQGFRKLFECYEIGKKRLYDIYKQDVEKSQNRITIGRRKHDIEIDTIAQQKKRQEKVKVNFSSPTTHSRKRQKCQKIEIVNEQCHGNVQECNIT
jgi:hypothetical protein